MEQMSAVGPLVYNTGNNSLSHFSFLSPAIQTLKLMKKKFSVLTNIKIFGISRANNVFYSIHKTIVLKEQEPEIITQS